MPRLISISKYVSMFLLRELRGAAVTKQIEVVILPNGRMNTKNASLYTGLSVATLAMHRCRGTGCPFTRRGRIFYDRADLDAWLRDGRAMSTAEARLRKDTDAKR